MYIILIYHHVCVHNNIIFIISTVSLPLPLPAHSRERRIREEQLQATDPRVAEHHSLTSPQLAPLLLLPGADIVYQHFRRGEEEEAPPEPESNLRI